MFFMKRNKQLLDQIDRYMELCTKDILVFDKAITHYLANGNDTIFEAFLVEAGAIEEKADDALHTIEGFLYKKSLLPESREDLKKLLERYDDIIDCTKHILIFMNTRNLSMPDLITSDIKEMVAVSINCYYKVKEAITDLLGSRRKIKELVHEINIFETQCDGIQARASRALFAADIDKYDKILLAELLGIIAKLTNYCEDAADNIVIINIKRVV